MEEKKSSRSQETWNLDPGIRARWTAFRKQNYERDGKRTASVKDLAGAALLFFMDADHLVRERYLGISEGFSRQSVVTIVAPQASAGEEAASIVGGAVGRAQHQERKRVRQKKRRKKV